MSFLLTFGFFLFLIIDMICWTFYAVKVLLCKSTHTSSALAYSWLRSAALNHRHGSRLRRLMRSTYTSLAIDSGYMRAENSKLIWLVARNSICCWTCFERHNPDPQTVEIDIQKARKSWIRVIRSENDRVDHRPYSKFQLHNNSDKF